MIDHLVYASTDLQRASADIAEQLGATPTPGGSHVGAGTHNELLSLGGRTYLEVIGPDPGQPAPDGARPFGIDGLLAAALVGWCVRPRRPLDEIVADARSAGIELGSVASMSRRRPDGVLLEWKLTFPQLDGPFGCVLPFTIDWGQSPHPTDTLTSAVRLIGLDLVHPDSRRLATALEIIGVDDDNVVVHAGGQPTLRATIATEHGDVTLTS